MELHTGRWKRFVNILQKIKTPRGRHLNELFSVEGYRLVERALCSGAPLQEVLISQSFLETPNKQQGKLLAQLERVGCPIHIAPDDIVRELTQGRTFGPIIGLLRALSEVNLDPLLSPEREQCKLLVLVGMMDPGNIGALMRTALASGVEAMVFLGGTDPFHPKAARTSMGAIFDIPLKYEAIAIPFITKLVEQNIQLVGAVVDEGMPPHNSPLSPRHALFIGSEAHGLPQSIQQLLDVRWSIPMYAEVDSFSVNAATAILLYEINRRSWANSPKSSLPS